LSGDISAAAVLVPPMSMAKTGSSLFLVFCIAGEIITQPPGFDLLSQQVGQVYQPVGYAGTENKLPDEKYPHHLAFQTGVFPGGGGEEEYQAG
jgi:hypothetical protein